MTGTEQRKKWIRYIQTARATLCLSDEQYLAVLGAADVDSSTKITTEAQFNSVKAALRLLGFSSGGTPFLAAVRRKAEKALGPAYKARLGAFLQNKDLPPLERCTPRELRQVMAFLSKLDKKGAAK